MSDTVSNIHEPSQQPAGNGLGFRVKVALGIMGGLLVIGLLVLGIRAAEIGPWAPEPTPDASIWEREAIFIERSSPGFSDVAEIRLDEDGETLMLFTWTNLQGKDFEFKEFAKAIATVSRRHGVDKVWIYNLERTTQRDQYFYRYGLIVKCNLPIVIEECDIQDGLQGVFMSDINLQYAD